MNKEKAETLLENYQELSKLYSNMRTELERTKKQLVSKCNQLEIAVGALKTFAQIPQPIAEVAKLKLYAINNIEKGVEDEDN